MDLTLPPRNITTTSLLEMKWTTPKVRPEAAWTKKEKHHMTAADPHSEPTRPSRTHSNPATVCTAHRLHSLPLIPNLRPISSETTPPTGRDTKFPSPKLAAIAPAVRMSTLNLLAVAA